MKKKIISVFLSLLLLLVLVPSARADDETFSIDQDAVLSGMGRSWRQGYEPQLIGEWLSVILPVSVPEGATDLRGELTEADSSVSPFRQQDMTAAVRRENGLRAFRFSLWLYDDCQMGDYPMTLHVTGTGAGGEELSADLPFVLRLRYGGENTEAARLQLNLTGGELKVGQEGTLTVAVTNPCRTLSAENGVLIFTDPSGDILPQSSDRFPLPELSPGESAELKLPVTVTAGAAVKPHGPQFSLKWTALGVERTQEEHLTVDVGQEIRLEQGGLAMAKSVVAGDSLTVTLPLMNMGRADIVNALVSVSLPGLVEKQSVLVGTIPPGETKQAQLSLSTASGDAGDYAGALTFEGSDADGNSVSFELPIELRVDEPAAPTEAGPAPSSGEPAPAVIILSVLCVLLAAALVLQTVRLTNKLHRLEEERL